MKNDPRTRRSAEDTELTEVERRSFRVLCMEQSLAASSETQSMAGWFA
jgi:hypothetical protein